MQQILFSFFFLLLFNLVLFSDLVLVHFVYFFVGFLKKEWPDHFTNPHFLSPSSAFSAAHPQSVRYFKSSIPKFSVFFRTL